MGICLSTAEGIAQISSAEEAYQHLDAFLEHPNKENATKFTETLQMWEPKTSEGKLAKVISYCNLGHFQMRSLQFQQAIANYENAKRLFQQHSLSGYDMIEFCYKPLGNLYTKTNALEEAENTIKEYILEAQSQQRKKMEAAGLLNLSVVFQNKGNYKQAIQILEQGIKLQPDNSDDFLINMATNHFSLGNMTKAEVILKPLLDEEEKDYKAFQLWAGILLAKGEPEFALQALEASQEELKKTQGSMREWGKLSLSLAQSQWTLGNSYETRRYLEQLYGLLIPNFDSTDEFPKEEQLFPDNTLIDALDLHAAVLTKDGEEAKAYSVYRQAFRVANLLEQTSTLQNTKLLQQTQNKIRSEKCLDLLYTLYQDEKKETWLEEAFYVDQQAKYPVLIEAKQWQRFISNKEDTLFQEWMEVKKELAQIDVNMEQMRQSRMNNLGAIQELQELYNQNLLVQRSIYQQLEEKYPDYKRTEAVGLAEVMQHCKEADDILVSYFFGKNTLYQFILDEEGVELRRLSTLENNIKVILQYINEYIQYFENSSRITSNPIAFAQSAHRLFKALQVPSAKQLTIVPDGILSFVPFTALLTESTQSTQFSKMPFLIKNTQVTYALSASDYLQPFTLKDQPSILGVFPIFSGTEKALNYSLEEANGVKKYTQATLLLNEEATATNFLQQANEYDVLHISTHAQGGTFSQSATIEFADRTVTLDELYGYEFDKDLVVLSACETGVGKIVKGEGSQNMARAFQYTGTNQVLFSLWNVNDYSTSQLMQQFYKELQIKKQINTSLREAQLQYLNESRLDNIKKSPYYWAAFVNYGVYEAPQYDLGDMLWYLLGAIFIFLLLFVLRNRFKKEA